MGPRIYNLFPLLFGPVSNWVPHLPRIAAMKFDWVYVNPFHYPGFSGSLYAVKDYRLLNPLIAGREQASDEAMKPFVDHARDAGLRVMMDLVINHTAKDSLLVERHGEWFAHEGDGSIRSPHAVDPTDASKITVWGDLAEIDYASRGVCESIAGYWIDLVGHYLALGIDGFRCDAAYKVPAGVWKRIISAAKKVQPRAVFAAETLGCRIDQVEALAGAGFDYFFNSVKWWDLHAPWAPEQYEQFRRIAPSIGFADNHDSPRLASEPPPGLSDAADVKRFCEMRYALAASFSTGVQMTGGFEFGFRRPLNVVRTRPGDWEEPWFQLSDEITTINRAKSECRALNEEGPMTHFERDGCVTLLKSTIDGTAHAVFVVNPFTTVDARLNLESAIGNSRIELDTLRNAVTGRPVTESGLTLDLGPLNWRLLTTNGGSATTSKLKEAP